MGSVGQRLVMLMAGSVMTGQVTVTLLVTKAVVHTSRPVAVTVSVPQKSSGTM